MKTFAEALKCLEKDEADRGDVTRIDLYHDEDRIHTEIGGPGADHPAMVSFAELGREVGANEEVRKIGYMIICLLLGVDKPGAKVTTSVATANIMQSIWTTAFTYGVRVGMEMEKQEMPVCSSR